MENMQQLIRILGSVIVLIFYINVNLMAQSLYFSTPQESVDLGSKLLIEEDWETLSKYYFLENSDKETITSMKSGRYFIIDKKPELTHPAVSWKYIKPFPPSYMYLDYIRIGADSIKVSVSLEIDQGNGMIQQGISSFYLIRSGKGYQFLP
jgi:hypothetical protein